MSGFRPCIERPLCYNGFMKRRIFLAILALIFAVAPSFSATRFGGLQRKLNSIARANYGRKVYSGYKIGISFVDVRTGQRLSVNGASVFPAASIIKLPIMAYLFHASDAKTVSLNKRVRVGEIGRASCRERV